MDSRNGPTVISAPRKPCLKRISAYQGGMIFADPDIGPSIVVITNKYKKKKLTFADDHGRDLVSARYFDRDSCTKCCSMYPDVAMAAEELWMFEDEVHILQTLSICIVSGSLLGCLLAKARP